MPWNSSGVFNRVHNWVNDRDGSIDITASRFDAENDDFASGIQACIAKNGENSATADLPMGSFQHTGAAAGSASGHYSTYEQTVRLADTQTITGDKTVSGSTTFTGNVGIDGTWDISGTQVTSAAAELNILDGATVVVAELNLLDGATVTTAEINILDGVTSTAAELNILDGATVSASDLNKTANQLMTEAISMNHDGGVTGLTITSTEAVHDTLPSINVTSGDTIIFTVMAYGTKGATAGSVRVALNKSSGTATVQAMSTYGAWFGSSYRDASTIDGSMHTGILDVTGPGTLVLDVLARSMGSNLTNATLRVSKIVMSPK